MIRIFFLKPGVSLCHSILWTQRPVRRRSPLRLRWMLFPPAMWRMSAIWQQNEKTDRTTTKKRVNNSNGDSSNKFCSLVMWALETLLYFLVSFIKTCFQSWLWHTGHSRSVSNPSELLGKASALRGRTDSQLAWLLLRSSWLMWSVLTEWRGRGKWWQLDKNLPLMPTVVQRLRFKKNFPGKFPGKVTLRSEDRGSANRELEPMLTHNNLGLLPEHFQ